jgi:hypothetical protein
MEESSNRGMEVSLVVERFAENVVHQLLQLLLTVSTTFEEIQRTLLHPTKPRCHILKKSDCCDVYTAECSQSATPRHSRTRPSIFMESE